MPQAFLGCYRKAGPRLYGPDSSARWLPGRPGAVAEARRARAGRNVRGSPLERRITEAHQPRKSPGDVPVAPILPFHDCACVSNPILGALPGSGTGSRSLSPSSITHRIALPLLRAVRTDLTEIRPPAVT